MAFLAAGLSQEWNIFPTTHPKGTWGMKCGAQLLRPAFHAPHPRKMKKVTDLVKTAFWQPLILTG
jgi:hypothetical protein